MDKRDAPANYTPWLIPVKKNGKDPDVKYSWKHPYSRLTIAEAVKRLKENRGNVGIAGRKGDALLLLDIDEPGIEKQVKKTLKIKSRSRLGTHAFYWAHPEDEKLPANIPTTKGELRTEDQYVVAPGSYVPVTKEELDEKIEAGEINEKDKEKVLKDPFQGYYTLDNQERISKIKFNELPNVFQEEYRERKKREKEVHEKETNFTPDKVEGKDTSALYELRITDLTNRGTTKRDPHPLHASSTGANWSINQGVGHCWRHAVSLNALQFLCVEAGYLDCHEAGTPHKGNGSAIIGDDQAIWVAWKHAKQQGYIPEDDPIPTRALKYIAKKHGVYKENSQGLLNRSSYNKAIEIVGEKY